MPVIFLGRTSQTALVDDADADLAALRWFVVDGYATRVNPEGTPRRISLHRVVMERVLGRALAPGEMVDHCNRIRSDCRRENLRLTSRATNGQNRSANRNSRSGYKGVSWFKAARKWRATLNVSGQHITIGYFDSLRDAVIAYNEGARTHFGEFAYLNPVPLASQPHDAD